MSSETRGFLQEALTRIEALEKQLASNRQAISREIEVCCPSEYDDEGDRGYVADLRYALNLIKEPGE